MSEFLSNANLFDINKKIDRAASKAEDVSLRHFRSAVWAVFKELVYTTPQFSGKAAANWNIGVGKPDFQVRTGLGEKIKFRKTPDGGAKIVSFAPHKVGDKRWAEEAIARNRPRLMQIKSKTRVYLCNGIKGEPDSEHGRTSKFYLADLQDPTYWVKRLRAENQPYRTVAEVLLSESWRGRLRLHGDSNNQEFFQ